MSTSKNTIRHEDGSYSHFMEWDGEMVEIRGFGKHLQRYNLEESGLDPIPSQELEEKVESGEMYLMGDTSWDFQRKLRLYLNQGNHPHHLPNDEDTWEECLDMMFGVH